MVHIDQFRRGLAAYADREIIDRLPYGTLKRVLAGSAVAIAMQRGLDNMLKNPAVQALGIVSGDEIDADLLRDTFAAQIPPEGMTVDLLGMALTFKPDDVQAIYRCVMEG